MAGAAVEVEGLKEFRKALKAVDPALAKEITKVHRDIAQMVGARAVGMASGMGGSTAHFATSIRPRGSAAGARLDVQPKANAAIFGAKKRTGWPNVVHGQGRPQHPAWVGSGWEPGGAGGPRGINPAIRASLTQIDDMFLDGIEEAARKAFPS